MGYSLNRYSFYFIIGGRIQTWISKEIARPGGRGEVGVFTAITEEGSGFH